MMTKNDPRIVPLRLQKFLARSGVASRRGSENLMTAGRVTVNGKVVTELGSKVDPRVDKVAVDGKEINPAGDAVTLMLNKPTGYVTTMSDPQGRPCVADLVPNHQYPGLFPIGRLDNNTSGLLLFSTDGELGHNLLHPKYEVDKVYEVVAEGMLDCKAISLLEDGVELDDGMTAPAKLEILQTGSKTKALITIHEGRKRQVRRMFEKVGHPVVSLKRLKFGPLELGDLKSGSWRLLNEAECARLYTLIGYEVK